MPLIRRRAAPNAPVMGRIAGKLLILLALLLVPLGMGAAPAAAAPHPGTGAAMAMEHCPDQPSGRDSSHAFAECTMACAAALPAACGPSAQLAPARAVPARAAAVRPPVSPHPDTETPPPRKADS